MKSIHERLSLLVSAPVIALAAVLALSLLTNTGSLSKLQAFLVGLVFHAGFSGAPALIDFRRGKVADFEFGDASKRRKYYALAAFGDACGLLVFWQFHAFALAALALTYVLSASLVAVINERWKISAHAAGLVGPLVLALALFGLSAIPLVVLVPFTFWLRLKTGAHDLPQLVGGALLAAGCALVALRAVGLL